GLVVVGGRGGAGGGRAGCAPPIGRAPIMMPAQFVRPMASQPYAGASGGVPFPPQAGAQNWTAPPSRPMDLPYTQQQEIPRPVVRAQSADEAPPASGSGLTRDNSVALRIPSPEDLGIGLGQRPAAAEVDWGAFHGRLNQLGATSFQTRRTPEGGYQVTCLLPSRQQ